MPSHHLWKYQCLSVKERIAPLYTISTKSFSCGRITSLANVHMSVHGYVSSEKWPLFLTEYLINLQKTFFIYFAFQILKPPLLIWEQNPCECYSCLCEIIKWLYFISARQQISWCHANVDDWKLEIKSFNRFIEKLCLQLRPDLCAHSAWDEPPCSGKLNENWEFNPCETLYMPYFHLIHKTRCECILEQIVTLEGYNWCF